MTLHLYATGVTFALAWLGFSIWTILKLRTGSRDERAIYKHGVRGFGLAGWAMVTVACALLAKNLNPNHELWYYGASLGFILLPICLWGGYAWGRIMDVLFTRRTNR